MDETIDFDLTMPLTTADKQEKLKEDCKKIAELFEASAKIGRASCRERV